MDAQDIEQIDPYDLTPVHERGERQFYGRHFEELVESMEEEVSFGLKRGWGRERPLLVLAHPDGKLQALTGSHRIAAAREVGLASIPCYILYLEEHADEEWAQALSIENWGHNDIDRMALIRQSGDEVAIAIMNRELQQG